eukprot:scaffold8549_cov95-Skeletonema_marinoi.AAC.1
MKNFSAAGYRNIQSCDGVDIPQYVSLHVCQSKGLSASNCTWAWSVDAPMYWRAESPGAGKRRQALSLNLNFLSPWTMDIWRRQDEGRRNGAGDIEADETRRLSDLHVLIKEEGGTTVATTVATTTTVATRVVLQLQMYQLQLARPQQQMMSPQPVLHNHPFLPSSQPSSPQHQQIQ